MSEPVLLWSCWVPAADLPKRKTRTQGLRPCLPRKDLYLTLAFGRIRTRESWRKALAKAYAKHGQRHARTGGDMRDGTYHGRLVLKLATIVTRRHATGPMAGQPLIDTDACLWCAKDSLAYALPGHAPVIDSDKQVVRDETCAGYLPEGPALRVELWSVP